MRLGVGLGVDAAGAQPAGDLLGVAHGEGVDDAAAGQPRELLGQLGEPLGLAGQAQGLQGQHIGGKRSLAKRSGEMRSRSPRSFAD